jgi:hypothetical protein
MNALETDKSMHVCARYSKDHARAQNLKKPEHETGRKWAWKLWELTMISQMCTDFPEQFGCNFHPNEMKMKCQTC